MNTYTWNCRTVDAYPTHTDEAGNTESQVVYNVHWRVTGLDETETHSATSIGTQTLETADLSGFTAFDSVTHENMVTWTKAGLGAERVTELEASLDSQITALITPPSVTLTISEPEGDE
jgi:hypothetical protein|tara:strand:- start:397 stop:753 length:357 start_codon:yes stop_codon:yes gene_type:complete